MSMDSLRRVIRSSEIRKAFGPEAMQLITDVAHAEEAHGRHIELLREVLSQHLAQHARMERSLLARLKWLTVGR